MRVNKDTEWQEEVPRRESTEEDMTERNRKNREGVDYARLTESEGRKGTSTSMHFVYVKRRAKK